MKKPEINWPDAVQPLLKKYKNKPHPLEAKNVYQFLVMVVLSAQSTDAIVNQLAPELSNQNASLGDFYKVQNIEEGANDDGGKKKKSKGKISNKGSKGK